MLNENKKDNLEDHFTTYVWSLFLVIFCDLVIWWFFFATKSLKLQITPK
jgi:hypothetical protein